MTFNILQTHFLNLYSVSQSVCEYFCSSKNSLLSRVYTGVSIRSISPSRTESTVSSFNYALLF